MTSQRTRDYELVMILSPEATESEASATARRVSELIADGGGAVSHQENWGARRLAYPIRRFIEGNYFVMRCVMEPRAANELDKTLNAAQDVLRHLIFRLEKSEIAAMEAQSERARQAKEREEARQAAERQARERDEARQAAEARAASETPPQTQTQAPPQTPPTQTQTPPAPPSAGAVESPPPSPQAEAPSAAPVAAEASETAPSAPPPA